MSTESVTEPSFVIDGQLHEIGKRMSAEIEDIGLRHRILGEVALATMDAAGVDAALLHADPSWARELMDEFPDRFKSVPMVHPSAGDPEKQVETAFREPGVVGVRAVIAYPPVTGDGIRMLEEGAWDPIFATCERLGRPVFAFVSGSLPLMRPTLDKFPDLTVVIDHIGIRQPPMDIREEPALRGLPDLLSLAEYPNVYVKLCGLPALSDEPYPFTDMWPALTQIVAAYRAERVFWGSDISRFRGRIGWDHLVENALGDYPGKHTYAESLGFIRDNPELDQSQKALLLGGTLQRLLDWTPAKDS